MESGNSSLDDGIDRFSVTQSPLSSVQPKRENEYKRKIDH